jgi:parallel beta-helix repeat protein
MTGNPHNLSIQLGGTYDIDASNTVNGRRVYYWVDMNDTSAPSDAGYLALVNCSDITITNLNLTNNLEGVQLYYSDNCTVTQNNIADNELGLYLYYSSNSTITFNNLAGNDEYAIQAGNCNFSSVCYNNIIGNPGLPSISFEGGSSNTIIRYNNLTDSGPSFLAGENNDVSYNNITEGGVYMTGNGNATICDNTIINSGWDAGIDFDGGNSLLSNNYIATGNDGVYLDGGSTNTVVNNTLINNAIIGFFLYESVNNVIYDNNVIGNGLAVMLSFTSDNNTFYHNNFINNNQSASTAFTGSNAFDDGYPEGGNYWSDYTGVDVHSGPYQNETGSDGIGDTPYVIDPNNIDHYPLVKPYAGPVDIGVTMSASKTVVPQGYDRTIGVNVKIINYGVQPENFNLTFQVCSSAQTQNVTLMMRNSTLLTFQFNVSGWTKGNYTLRAAASQVPGETDTSDSTCQGLFSVSILGDVNGDGRVDMRDVAYVARLLGVGPTSPLWNPNADVNDTGTIGMTDINTVASQFGQSWN